MARGTMQRETFDAGDLLSAITRVHEGWEQEGSSGSPGPDEPARRYRRMIEDRNAFNLETIVPVLTSWRAYRGTGSGQMMHRVLARLISERRRELDYLRGLRLEELSDRDLETVAQLVRWLQRRGFKPTAWGKSLHMLAPDAVLLWDRQVVRGRYGLPDDVEGFLAYQRFGRRLAESLGGDLARVQRKHLEAVGYMEPIPKMIDELAFDWDGSARAVLSLGGHATAFDS